MKFMIYLLFSTGIGLLNNRIKNTYIYSLITLIFEKNV